MTGSTIGIKIILSKKTGMYLQINSKFILNLCLVIILGVVKITMIANARREISPVVRNVGVEITV